MDKTRRDQEGGSVTKTERSSWKEVASQIRSGIREGRFGEGKLPSEAMLMRQFGASKMTVHRALRELSTEGLIHRVERVGTFVSPPSAPTTRKIGLVLPTTAGFLEFNLLAGVRDALDVGDQYVLYATNNDPVTEAEALQRATSEVDGILIVPTGHPKNARRLQQMYDDGLSVVCVDRACVGFQLPAVTTNNYDVSRDGLLRLTLDQAHRVAYFGIYDPAVSSLADRYRAYQDICGGQTGDPTEFVRFIPPHLGDHAQVSFRLLEDSLVRLLTRPDAMTLAFCANEYYLEAIVQVCNNLPREMSQSLEILSFNDWPRLRYQGFRVHTIRQNAYGIGQKAADLLHRIWKGERVEARPYEIDAMFIHADTPYDMGTYTQLPQPPLPEKKG